MKKSFLTRLILTVFLGILSTTSGWSQTAEVSVTGGKSLAGARLAVNTWVFMGHELSYAYRKNDSQTDDEYAAGVKIHNYFYNFVVHAMPQGSVMRPFITAGVGFSTFVPPGVSSLFTYSSSTKPGINFGGGVKFRLGRRYGIRYDMRKYITGRPSRILQENATSVEHSAGFSFLF